MDNKRMAMVFAVLAAALYAVNVPLSKMLMGSVSPTALAGLLYLGAGLGMGLLLLRKQRSGRALEENWLTREDLPYTLAMVLLDIAAPIFLMFGVSKTNSANASLLNNFEIVATSVIALAVFKEKISGKLWTAILLVLGASVLLTFEGEGAFVFNEGSLLVLCACLCWGIENNCTRSISDKSSQQIVVVKGLCSGAGSLAVAFFLGESLPELPFMLAAMGLGFVSYGLSIHFYILAQKHLGAAKVSAFYSIAPFLGVGFGFLLLGERPNARFYLALLVMAVSTWIMVKDTLGGEKLYEGYVHTHPHRHGELVHTHEHRHMVYNPMHIHSHSHAG